MSTIITNESIRARCTRCRKTVSERFPMKEDSDPTKRRMKGQTEVKHDILEKYLQPWLLKITEISSDVRYIDGFAGWGRYEDGSPGSPLIAMNVAKDIIEEDVGRIGSKLNEFLCSFIEADRANFESLEAEVEKALSECPSQIKAEYQHGEFEEFARQYIEEAETDGPRPSFIFIDPFGYSGLPFDIVKQLLGLRSSGIEVFVTFVAGEMARFLFSDEESHARAITEILGTDRWKEEIDQDISKEEKVDELLRIYEEQLRDEADVDYVWPFRMSRESKDETVYYLVHATNHFDGFKLMKDIMFNTGAEDQFAYLGPNHYPYLEEQQALSEFDHDDERETDRRVEELADYLHNRFTTDEEFTFWTVMVKTYQETSLIEKHYREAIYELADQNRARIINHPNRVNGTETGLQYDDEVIFLPVSPLSNWT